MKQILISQLQEYNIFKNILSFFPLSKHGLCPLSHSISLVKSLFTLEKSQLIMYFNNIKNIIIKSTVATWCTLYILPIITYFIGDMSLILMIFPLSLFTSPKIVLDLQTHEDYEWNKSKWFKDDVVLPKYSANPLLPITKENLEINYFKDTYGIRDVKLLQDNLRHPSYKEKIIKWFKNINLFKNSKIDNINESKWWD